MLTSIISVPMQINSLVQERYRITKLLGSTPGGYKYRAVDRCLTGGNFILVEEIPGEPDSLGYFQYMQLGIGTIVEKLKLPLLESFSGTVEDNGHVFMVWEEYGWPTLDELVTTASRLEEKRAIVWAVEIARTLKVLLDNQVAAYSLPASSVAISPACEVSLASLNFLKIANDSLEAKEEAAWAQVRELGKLLYFMLSGIEWSDKAPKLSEVNPRVSRGMESLIERSLGGFDPDIHRIEKFVGALESMTQMWSVEKVRSRFLRNATFRFFFPAKTGKKSA